jgi:hypothetical protein
MRLVNHTVLVWLSNKMAEQSAPWKYIHIPNQTAELNLAHTFFNGQCFNWITEGDGVVGVIGASIVELRTENDYLAYRFIPDVGDGEAVLRQYL